MGRRIPCDKLVLAGAIGMFASVSLAGPHYVRPPGTCTNTQLQAPYGSWDAAATNIQWAVDSAMASLPATVWITNGNYCVTSQVVATNAVVIRSVSGWTNTSVYADWPAYTTRVFYISNNVVLDGLTVSNGHNVTSLGGGGIYAASNSIVRNCRIMKNVCSNLPISSICGGGVHASRGSVVSNCLALQNGLYGSWQNGGGIALSLNSLAVNSHAISNYRIVGSTGSGGGIYGGLNTIISNCFIAFNSFQIGNGIASAGLVTDCDVVSNSGDWAGVSILNNGIVRNSRVLNNGGWSGAGIAFEYSAVGIVTNCYIAGNPGPGLWIDRSYPKINNCIITGNRNSGIFNLQSYGMVVDSCLISNNLAVGNTHSGSVGYPPGGAGVYLRDGLVRNCVIHHNTNLSIALGGGIIMTNAAGNTNMLYGVVNCVIADNYSTNEGGGVALFGESNLVANCIIVDNISHSNIYPDVCPADLRNTNNFWNCCANSPSAPLPPSQGNITNYPVFADSAYRLNVNSPCINAGLNQRWMTNAVDLDCQKRIFDRTVDIGPFERVYSGAVFCFQ